jgi:hypothetical protein
LTSRPHAPPPAAPRESVSPYPSLAAEGLAALVGRELSPVPPPSGAATARYRIDALLGAGSQALTFSATRLSDEGAVPVVVKVWRPSFVRSLPREAALSLRKEWLGLERQRERVPRSAHVVHGLDRGEISVQGAPSTPWVALERVAGGLSGTTLHERVVTRVRETGAGLSPPAARRLVEGLVAGVTAIHETGLFHRDLKPSNVLVAGDGPGELFKVSDLGVARAAGMATTFGAHVAVGSVGYAAPEQASGEDLGPWSDVFSLGSILFFALTGECLYPGNLHAALARIIQGDRARLSAATTIHRAFRESGVLPALEASIAWATAPHIDARPVSAAEWAERLTPALAHAEARTPPETAPSASVAPESFTRVHHPAHPMELRAVALAADGTAIAASAKGLFAWDGAGSWEAFSFLPDGLDPARIGGLAGPFGGRWLASLDGGELVGFAPDRVLFRHAFGADLRAGPMGASSPSDLALAFRGKDGRTRVFAAVAGAWQRPLDLDGAETLTGIAAAAPGGFALATTSHVYDWAPRTGALHRRAEPGGALFAEPGSGLWIAGDGGVGLRGALRSPATAGYLAVRAAGGRVVAVGRGGWVVMGG